MSIHFVPSALLFDAGQAAYRSFIRAFYDQQKRRNEGDDSEVCCAENQNNELKEVKKLK